MLAKDLVSDYITPLRPTETGTEALRLMNTFRVSHLPVVKQDEFIGTISDVDIPDKNLENVPIGLYAQTLFSPFVYEYQHLYEVVEIVSRLDLTAIAVLSGTRQYFGCITTRQLVKAFGNFTAMRSSGGILVLELNANDYSISQIARILEDNNAKLLSYYVTSPADSVKLEVTLKIDQVDLTSIIQTFIRYDYNIVGAYQSRDHNEEILRNNYEQFMMYMNI